MISQHNLLKKKKRGKENTCPITQKSPFQAEPWSDSFTGG